MAKVNPVQVEKFLGGVNYPAGKQDLVKHAQQHGADQNLTSLLQRLPDKQYGSPIDVSEAIGKLE